MHCAVLCIEKSECYKIQFPHCSMTYQNMTYVMCRLTLYQCNVMRIQISEISKNIKRALCHTTNLSKTRSSFIAEIARGA